MSIATTLEYASVDELFLDPQNPRLGRHRTKDTTSPEELLKWMREFVLDEIALSYIENGGFWAHEPLMVVKENLYDEPRLVVVEGNRRLASLKYLKAEKAGYIAKLIEEEGLSYSEVMRKIGSKTPTVKRHYVAYRTLIQMEDDVEDFNPAWADNRFAVLYMSIQTEGAKKYLNVNIHAEPEEARRPIPDDHIENLGNFAKWLFGTDETEPLVKDTRVVSRFGKALESDTAVKYLEESSDPNLDLAFKKAGGDEEEVVLLVQRASDNIQVALQSAHLFNDSEKVQDSVLRFGKNANQLLSIFPDVQKKL